MAAPIWQAPSAELYGDIRIGNEVSIWPQAVLRAEMHHIEIGDHTNVQDFVMLHVANGPVVIGQHCSLTHHCIVHGAEVGDNTLIGINATPAVRPRLQDRS